MNVAAESERETAHREVAATWIAAVMFFPLVAAWWFWADTLIEHLAVIVGFAVAGIAVSRIERRKKVGKG